MTDEHRIHLRYFEHLTTQFMEMRQATEFNILRDDIHQLKSMVEKLLLGAGAGQSCFTVGVAGTALASGVGANPTDFSPPASTGHGHDGSPLTPDGPEAGDGHASPRSSPMVSAVAVKASVGASRASSSDEASHADGSDDVPVGASTPAAPPVEHPAHPPAPRQAGPRSTWWRPPPERGFLRDKQRHELVPTQDECNFYEQEKRRGHEECVHEYRFEFVEGHLGENTRVGFRFAAPSRKWPLKDEQSIYMTPAGKVFIRDRAEERLIGSLPPLSIGAVLDLSVDLFRGEAAFRVGDVRCDFSLMQLKAVGRALSGYFWTFLHGERIVVTLH